MKCGPDATGVSRRRFLTFVGGVACSTLAMPHVARAGVIDAAERRLAVENLHTGEALSVAYRVEGKLVPDALEEINYVLRDHRTGDVVDVDVALIDLLSSLRRQLGTGEPFGLVSGYRSPKTNAMLRKNSNGVAKRSYHMKAMAADIRLPGVDLATLRKAALDLRQGGVGYYPKSGFIHVDVGPVRSW